MATYFVECIDGWFGHWKEVRPGVDFLNVDLRKQFIETALSIFAIHRCPNFLLQIRAKSWANGDSVQLHI